MYSHYPAHYTFDRDSDAWQIGFTTSRVAICLL